MYVCVCVCWFNQLLYKTLKVTNGIQLSAITTWEGSTLHDKELINQTHITLFFHDCIYLPEQSKC